MPEDKFSKPSNGLKTTPTIKPVKRYSLSLCGVECAIEEHGNANGEPLVFLHGWLDNLASFYPLVPHLQQHRLILLDFPGHGLSHHLPAGMAYHFLDLVFVVQDLVAELKLKDFVLVGHSMGGAAATTYTSSQQGKVRQLILIEALGPLTLPASKSLKQMRDSIADRSALLGKQKPVYPSYQLALTHRAKVSQMEPEVIEPIVKRGLNDVNEGVTWRSDPRLRVSSVSRLTEEQLTPLLEAIECPVLLLEAEQGMFTENAIIQARKEKVSHLTTSALSGGHHVHMEQPQAVALAIEQFISQK
ncbi:alpha/beta fold hydrolase [Pleionea sp. CnH1-48]|uniref:alpha/beta fold hydrolase n=1 Tax=Pleionea sp. CnH1-48 TaxID=2954494 RepID=UPI002097723B|nr:alpha/beta hydrolase [Pleionea sp. CnH1-48]MCO7227263.1 alpha/beta hydrolase [Pleionea sp. CnH1-48]